MEEYEEIIKLKNLPKSLIENPYKKICEWAEELYPKIGGEVFEFLSLLPCSLIINDFVWFSEKKRSNLNLFLLTEAGGAKSSLCKLFSKIAYYPIEGRSYTPAELEDEVFEKEIFSLIIEDYTTMAMDERINKIIEGVIGDEKIIDRHTKKKKIRKNVEAVALLCGVPEDITNKLTRGKMSRTIIIVKIYDDEEHSLVGKYISDNIGFENKNYKNQFKEIKEYYNFLQEIQAGETKLQVINDFEISKEIRKDIEESWDNLTREMRKKGIKFNFQRELEDGFRILISHAFLNYFHREKKGGTLIVTNEDCEIAKKLMKKSLITKYNLYCSERLASGIRSVAKFHEIMSSGKFSKETKQLIPVFMKKEKIK